MKEIQRIFKALNYSFSGFRWAIKEEAAFKTECILTAALVPLAIILPFHGLMTILILCAHLSVLALELLNIGLEKTTDVLFQEQHMTAKIIKDTASCAVLMGLLATGALWIYALWGLIA